ncbi:MAG: undecaprenyldiphospho-muramoylpentapeptide beta-N-acetylglucosaminyltransferase [Candidatus Magasanikbacteria bacterium RIFCSPHIGHO2_01_FULL_50_8]|uniref:UDP-N-acetylglucosamine--N-acetylmuramyl-(pentapeptide) pyrophosphoryl-undecaprenol N-acetylglucosamine transferase n=1 Tax=Candidatus Magasanikbacteria bacterium RIFCSPHIGHO2_01_FULL_50_8 TaxID=1798674 RepID=A0A1F6LNW4_9BACT|nr:MAG: undecaprenyldiphospho-muramoylpentapeptide beta-N-acetylglucosaminyltransferase [Candidatus Magasanikbacteria bacterium RIFCSPHIGHO2_01_FULL_50_8]
MKILLSGGGTLGPVTPLLALVETARTSGESHEFFWIGTERGVELPLVRKAGIQTYTIPSGKIRRYFDFKNFSDLCNMVRGFFAARRLLKELQPDVVMSAGGFVSVPVHYAAWMLGIPSVVHQQDVLVGLSNRLMSWIATRVTVSLEQQLTQFNKRKVVCTGNPVRPSVMHGSRERGVEIFHLDPDRATVFVFGGGTGSDAMNRAVAQIVAEYDDGQLQIIHLTGRDRRFSVAPTPYYHPYQFFTAEMADAYAVADVVVSRSGFNAITEICAWGKPSILVPIKNSHQEANAAYAAAAGGAFVVDEGELDGARLFGKIRDLLADEESYDRMARASFGLFRGGAAGEILGVLESVQQN